jgi:hypothetical protein
MSLVLPNTYSGRSTQAKILISGHPELKKFLSSKEKAKLGALGKTNRSLIYFFLLPTFDDCSSI